MTLFSIPDSWAWTTLGDIAEVVGGVTKDSKKQSDPDLPLVPYLRVANVQRGYLDLEKITDIRVPEATVEKLRLQPGDVLLNEGGDRDKLGRGWVWDGQIKDCIHQNHVFRARLHTGVMIPKLLAWFANECAREWFDRNAAQSVNLASISLSKIKSLPVPIPPVGEQRRIAAALESHLLRLDVGGKGVVKSVTRSKALWRSVLNDAVSGRLVGRDITSDVRLLGDVSYVQGGIQKQKKRRPIENKFPFLRVANVPRGSLDLADVHEVELFDGELQRFRLAFGDLLVVEGNGSPDQIGRAAMWRDEILDCVHQNHLIRVRPNSKVDPHYLELVWNSPTTASQLRKVASSTSGLHTLSTAKVKAIQIPVPSLEVQHSIVTEAQRWRSYLEAAQRMMDGAKQRSDALQRSLLKEAFAGRLVPQDPTDEPASDLLAQIKAERTAQPKPQRARHTKPKESFGANPAGSPAASRTEWPDASRTPTTYEQGELL
ncbi:restriction endonuclease subunit S [Streptosporangium sp. NBC_01756]|uniref:restriction endonuclease subunit S n=1 Tax=Streptosporangium sp. NBC_01756 TaxID=2975950 RepID=UPI002DDAF179|nr:restriction endonuclease subunit S [Streptosporangium sp. NBC_01756]WSC88508.1 restriction endonuclease subunit S [Streptosporangium sp. NBC_01756]